jgi:hypothetical protein
MLLTRQKLKDKIFIDGFGSKNKQLEGLMLKTIFLSLPFN